MYVHVFSLTLIDSCHHQCFRVCIYQINRLYNAT